jgi:adenylate cyclase
MTPSQAGGWLVATAAATAALTHLMFRAGLMISTSELYLAGLISLLSSSIFRFLTAEKRGSFFQNAISVFVGKKFAATISEEQHISLSGSRQLVTILFSDIRGFTAFCEEKDPALVVDLLNEYMGGMVKIIVSYHGNVNKFIGDGILAIFSDEDGTAPGDHALRAVRCGTEMAQLPGRFKTGVGIHTGFAVVGNVGSQDKMEYTVLGDTVNLASRLESLNKEMKTQLILSEATRELLNGQFETVYLGDVPIRGKTVPLVVHTAAVLRAPKQESGTLAEKS